MLPTRIADPFERNVIGQYQASSAVPQPDRPRTSFIVIHHAAFEYTPGDAVRSIFAYHSTKWPKYGRCGYHEIIQIEPDGSLRCYRVNPPQMQGAGVALRNHECFHICAATNFGASIPEQLWIDAIARRATVAKRRDSGAQIVGHREIALPVSPTACPGTRWEAWKPMLLTQVASMLAQQPAIQRYRMKPVPIFQGQNGDGPIAGYLYNSNEHVGVDKTYPNGMAHLSDGRGFVRLDLMEKV